MAMADTYSLQQAIAAALQNDPEFQGLLAKTRADTEVISQARSALLPRVQFQATQTSNNTSIQSQGAAPQSFAYDYTARNQSLTLSQPLYRRSALMELNRSEVAVSASELELAAGMQQSIDRVTNAFIEKLSVDTNIKSVQAELEAKELQLTLSRQQLLAGFGSLVDVKKLEAQTQATRAKIEELRAKQVLNATSLERLTGRAWPNYFISPVLARTCAENFKTSVNESISNLKDFPLQRHPKVAALQMRYDAAGWETSKRTSAHYPTLDLIASVTQGKSASELVIGRDINTQAIGFQLVVPIYSGGSTSSAVREAAALRDKAEMDLRNMQISVANERSVARAQILATIAKISSDLAAMEAAELALQLETRRLQQGIGSDVDLSIAHSRYYSAAASLAITGVKLISDYSKLRLADGDLSQDSLSGASSTIRMCLDAPSN
jgi:TolC family type I secretion outer membrane protein